jgi:hypothetical protein
MRLTLRDRVLESVFAGLFVGLYSLGITWVVEDTRLGNRIGIYEAAEWDKYHPNETDPRIKHGLIWGAAGLAVGAIGRTAYDSIRERKSRKEEDLNREQKG